MEKEISNQEKALGKLIKDKRKEKKLTGSEIGQIVGVSKSAVSRWEKGEVRNIKLSRIEKLCEILDIDPLLFVKKNKGLGGDYIMSTREKLEGLGIDTSNITDESIKKLALEMFGENKKAAD